MKIKKLIKQLKKLEKKHGNIPVYTHQMPCFSPNNEYDKLVINDLSYHHIKNKEEKVLVIY